MNDTEACVVAEQATDRLKRDVDALRFRVIARPDGIDDLLTRARQDARKNAIPCITASDHRLRTVPVALYPMEKPCGRKAR
nr:hypothetical protein [Falsirhodobacter deserti]